MYEERTAHGQGCNHEGLTPETKIQHEKRNPQNRHAACAVRLLENEQELEKGSALGQELSL